MEQDPASNAEPPEDDWRTPPSFAPEFEEIGPNGEVIRKDAGNRTLCKARRRDGNLCKAPVVRGLTVCRTHGGSSPQARAKAKLRLAELANPAIATLAKEMVNADKSADRQRAANSILDRAGYGRHQSIEVEDAKDLLKQRLMELRDSAQTEKTEQ